MENAMPPELGSGLEQELDAEPGSKLEERLDPDPRMKELLLLDRMNEPEEDAMYAFALDERLGRMAGDGGPGICHLWRHPRAFVLGTRDARLPEAAEAARWLETQGYDAIVRHSGGAAVPLDDGVVNVSLILPERDGAGDFRRDFDRMYALVRDALAGTGKRVDKGEIRGSYCPGDYDLSIDGLKFCGIAQRRQARATIVQAFVVAEGSGARRARLVREFYARAAGAETDPEAYPRVTEDSMASLGELANLGRGAAVLFAEAIKARIRSGQTGEGLAAAAAALRMPSAAEVREEARRLRARYDIAKR